MDYGALLTESKWNIVKELASKDQTPTELAEKTQTSLANVSQQLRLLEAYGLVVKKRKSPSRQPGKPRNVFSVGKEINHVISISKLGAKKKDLNLDYFQKAVFNLLVGGGSSSYYLLKFLIMNEEVIQKCDCIGHLKRDGDKIELLLVTDHVQDIREKYSNQTLGNLEGKKKQIVCWTHSIHEMEEGLRTKNDHFVKLVHGLEVLMEKKNFCERVKEVQNEENT